jgi:hypothetical protein
MFSWKSLATVHDVRSTADVAEELVGKRVLTIVSNPDTGYSLFQLGEWRARSTPIANPNLTEQQRHYRGTDSVFVQCPWELYSPLDLREEEALPFGPGERLRLLDVMIDNVITAVRFEGLTLDLRLTFDSEVILTLNPNQTSDLPSYSIGLANQYWTVHAKGRIEEQHL